MMSELPHTMLYIAMVLCLNAFAVQGSWSEWSSCSASCGSGTKSRQCRSYYYDHYGNYRQYYNYCDGYYSGAQQTEHCNTRPCPVNGGWSDWSVWSICPQHCSTYAKIRNRTCSNPAPLHGGANCSGINQDVSACGENQCAVNGAWSAWVTWSTCSVTCGKGRQDRMRTCSEPSPQYGGLQCSGASAEAQNCTLPQECPVDGKWTEWGDWSVCPQSCSSYPTTRIRLCANPAPAHGGINCTGSDREFSICSDKPCPVNGGWAAWSAWSTCSASCGLGSHQRSRSCTKPSPKHGGLMCEGIISESEDCISMLECPVNGAWSEWSLWSSCAQRCRSYATTRIRSCDNPSPQHGGDDCTGNAEEFVACGTNPCPVHGEWTHWGSWSACSASCGSGVQTRERTCTQPRPQHGGKDCIGFSNETEKCSSENECPVKVNGGWSDWGDWSVCPQTCSSFATTRIRLCDNPAPAYGGINCTGTDRELSTCSDKPCPVNGGWTEWSRWSTCSATCGLGSHQRSRDCTKPSPKYGGLKCQGEIIEYGSCMSMMECPVNGNWSEWSSWSTCTLHCRSFSTTRVRSCDNPSPKHGGANCTGQGDEFVSCGFNPCPVHGGWTHWGSWSTCSASCGSGVQTRERTCTQPRPQHGGKHCSGLTDETGNCSSGNECPINGGWSNWSEWTLCPELCWLFSSTRSRLCDNPVPLHGGDNCTGADQEFATCGKKLCAGKHLVNPTISANLTHNQTTLSSNISKLSDNTETHSTLAIMLPTDTLKPKLLQSSVINTTVDDRMDKHFLESTKFEIERTTSFVGTTGNTIYTDQAQAEPSYINARFESVTDVAIEPHNITSFKSAELTEEDLPGTVTSIVTESKHPGIQETAEDITTAALINPATRSGVDSQTNDNDKPVITGNINDFEQLTSLNLSQLVQTVMSSEHGIEQKPGNTSDVTLNMAFDGTAHNLTEAANISPGETEIASLTTAAQRLDPSDDLLPHINSANALNASEHSYDERQQQDKDKVIEIVLGTVIPIAIICLISLLIYIFRRWLRARCWTITTDEEENNSKASCKNLEVSKDVQENPYQEIDIRGHALKQSLPEEIEEKCLDA